jgi:hypothetical protein
MFIPQMKRVDSDGGMILTGENRKRGEKPFPSVTLSTTNPTWTDPGLRGETSATNRLSYSRTRIKEVITN